MSEEVCSVVDVSQFEPGKTVDACGFYAISLLKHSGKPGQAPTGNASQVAAWADAEYTKYDGPDVASNNNGMTMQTLFNVLGDAGLHYQVIGSTEIGFHPEHLTIAYIRAWLQLGYPVLIALAEDAVYDFDLKGSPYAWNTSGLYHIIVATGEGDNNNLLCHDTASIDASGKVRPGPRKYNATHLQDGLISATAVVLTWMQRPSADYDPIADAGVPAGWTDDGQTLWCPDYSDSTKKVPIVLGNRGYVKAHNWNPGNVALSPEYHVSQVQLHNLTLGPGQIQLFRDGLLWYTEAKGVVWEPYLGLELQAAYALIAQLQAQTPVVQPKIDMVAATAALTQLAGVASSIEQGIAALKTALNIQ